MKKIFAVSIAALVLVLSGCTGSDDADEQTDASPSENSMSEVAKHMGLQETDDATWTFETTEGETCIVAQVLNTPVLVQEQENAGAIVAVNPAGSAGVMLPEDVTDSCHDAAIDLLSDYQ